ncbi:HXXEE domain-containing protein [Mesorhizobium sp. M2A.F.Ca.ET.043.05.1.1]|uniref:HXXEE domain-containing protein n=1 Tax=Mesorhizobium sp. M2A.F.Ca.ET.043.05.1.1 TaxID=2493671 RepID=UPI0032B2FE7A
MFSAAATPLPSLRFSSPTCPLSGASTCWPFTRRSYGDRLGAWLPPYVLIVNALAHLVTSARLRKYNPGLITSVLLFLPLSVATIWTIGRTAGLLPHLIGAALAILLHLAISWW